MSNETCPHCGAEKRNQTATLTAYECGTVYLAGHIYERDYTCYERQIEQLKKVIKDAIPILEYHWEMVDDGVFYECPELENAKTALGLIKGEVK